MIYSKPMNTEPIIQAVNKTDSDVLKVGCEVSKNVADVGVGVLRAEGDIKRDLGKTEADLLRAHGDTADRIAKVDMDLMQSGCNTSAQISQVGTDLMKANMDINDRLCGVNTNILRDSDAQNKFLSSQLSNLDIATSSRENRNADRISSDISRVGDMSLTAATLYGKDNLNVSHQNAKDLTREVQASERNTQGNLSAHDERTTRSFGQIESAIQDNDKCLSEKTHFLSDRVGDKHEQVIGTLHKNRHHFDKTSHIYGAERRHEFEVNQREILESRRIGEQRANNYFQRNQDKMSTIELQAEKNHGKSKYLAAQNTAAIQLEAAKNIAAVQFEALRNRSDIMDKISHCCCETKERIRESEDRITGRIERSELSSVRDALLEERLKGLRSGRIVNNYYSSSRRGRRDEDDD
jgi:hypothetical protein